MGARLSGTSALRPGGAILAGGSASRLDGSAKGLMEVGGRRIIDRISDALAPVVESIVVVANTPDAHQWLAGSRVVSDILTGGGSAAGVHAALRAFERPVLVVAWDMPFVTTELFRLLVDHAERADADAVVPAATAPGQLEPLCAWYGPACAAAIEAAWSAGHRSLHHILERVNTAVVPVSELAAVGDPARLFLNVNTPADVARAVALAGDGAASKRR